MTLEQVNDYFYLKYRIDQLTEYIRRLEEATQPKSPDLSGMPHSPSPKDKLGDLIPKIADAEKEKEECKAKLDEIEQFFASIRRPKIRSIITYRYKYQLQWNEVAERMGLSEDSVKKAWYRVLSDSEK